MIEAEIEILVLELQAGRRTALGELYQHFHVSMRKYAVLRVGDAMIAEDLVQNVWLQVAKRVMRLRDVSLFRSWLFKALRWEIIDWQRKATKEVPSLRSPETTVSNGGDDASYVLPLLAKLAYEEREMVELYYLNDMSVREISLIVDVPMGTVKSRLHRAREQLKQHIKQTG
ncbi:MAG: RNA polymerase sigma factor [Alteromonas sp.]